MQFNNREDISYQHDWIHMLTNKFHRRNPKEDTILLEYSFRDYKKKKNHHVSQVGPYSFLFFSFLAQLNHQKPVDCAQSEIKILGKVSLSNPPWFPFLAKEKK